ncbi:MAG: hypothetical protein A3E84_00195 [Gammaproteobacteria bacterium RIFCSPHIGHO2_12_FULL_42_13]|nr:MAG: hypothetical protein A3E84_00195 [Gammaproteobacteria bacterium RIFCSPHIGHO2_12_FULL_42_13]
MRNAGAAGQNFDIDINTDIDNNRNHTSQHHRARIIYCDLAELEGQLNWMREVRERLIEEGRIQAQIIRVYHQAYYNLLLHNILPGQYDIPQLFQLQIIAVNRLAAEIREHLDARARYEHEIAELRLSLALALGTIAMLQERDGTNAYQVLGIGLLHENRALLDRIAQLEDLVNQQGETIDLLTDENDRLAAAAAQGRVEYLRLLHAFLSERDNHAALYARYTSLQAQFVFFPQPGRTTASAQNRSDVGAPVDAPVEEATPRRPPEPQ